MTIYRANKLHGGGLIQQTDVQTEETYTQSAQCSGFSHSGTTKHCRFWLLALLLDCIDDFGC